ncbi:elongation factor Tu, mitochondrial [Nephila pilipes]|uniref:Elongation factor Tu, mitochondrial n=1 Tax=Nephila pilipes TaxID=299642 RepID=A0A8X6T983_NEPPI|nr:elongation factor Tu, mitochondrial [Nephila pilipes]
MIAIDCTDIAHFLELFLLSGYHWVPKEDYNWSTADNLKVDIVPKSDDKLVTIAPIHEELGGNLRQFGTFHKKLSIDELKVPYYGHHTCKMSIKGKSIRLGFKIWMLCSSSGYPYVIGIYSGRMNELSGMPLGEDVVTQLPSKIADRSRHEIYFYNFLHRIIC